MKYAINLLPQERHEALSDKVFYFILNYLRYIIIITQSVVIIVFVEKFTTDQQIVDLQESIDQKYEILSVFQPLAKDATALSFKMKEVSSTLRNQEILPKILIYLLSAFPKEIYLKQLSIKDDTVIMHGTTTDPLVLREFYRRLSGEKLFETVDLKNINKVESGYEFDMSFQNFKKI